MSVDLGSNIDAQKTDIKINKPKGPTSATTRIVLEENEDIPPTGLFLAHNGRGYMIRPGEEVDVPNELIEILDHAVVSVPQIDPQTRQVVGTRDRLRFGYRMVRQS